MVKPYEIDAGIGGVTSFGSISYQMLHQKHQADEVFLAYPTEQHAWPWLALSCSGAAF